MVGLLILGHAFDGALQTAMMRRLRQYYDMFYKDMEETKADVLGCSPQGVDVVFGLADPTWSPSTVPGE